MDAHSGVRNERGVQVVTLGSDEALAGRIGWSEKGWGYASALDARRYQLGFIRTRKS